MNQNANLYAYELREEGLSIDQIAHRLWPGRDIPARERAMRETAVDRKHTLVDNLYIAGMEWNYGWTPTEKMRVVRLWREGYSVQQIAERVKRAGTEVCVLVLDQKQKGRI